MKQLGGGTNMAMGFQLIFDQMSKIITPNHKPIIIFITNGEPTDRPEESIRKIMKMDPKPTIITVGICPPSNQTQFHKRLSAMIPGEPLFLIEDYAMLNDKIQQLKVAERKPPPCRIKFYPKKIGRMRSDISLCVQLEPEPDDPIPAQTRITFKENHFFYSALIAVGQDIPIGQSRTFGVLLKVKPNANYVGSFPDTQNWTIEYPNGQKYSSAFGIPVAWYCGDFLVTNEEEAKVPTNILVWGKMGSGKSSLINDIIGIFQTESEKVAVATVLNAASHVTTTFTKFPVRGYLQKKGGTEEIIASSLNLNIWDSWGLTEDNYKPSLITSIVEGKLKENTEMDTTIETEPADHQRRIHAVILPIPIGAGQETALLRRLHELLIIFLRLKLRPIIVCTMCSQMDPESVTANYEAIVKELGVQEDMVILHDNYTKEARNIRQDLRIRAILEKAYKLAKETKTSLVMNAVSPQRPTIFRRSFIAPRSPPNPPSPVQRPEPVSPREEPFKVKQSPKDIAKLAIKTNIPDERHIVRTINSDWTLAQLRTEIADQLQEELTLPYQFHLANGSTVQQQDERNIKLSQCTSDEEVPSIRISTIQPPESASTKILFKTENGDTVDNLYVKLNEIKTCKDLRGLMVEDQVLEGRNWLFLDKDGDRVRPRQEQTVGWDQIVRQEKAVFVAFT
eukprot:TRINITY_DN2300_c0_g1_i4.p1 TRINITY_DN2300_c0_g1~~TRINITY_DN2300_c0_g1_i4.p1  ORF type:complete len:746 (+),score=168.89 TRINITY_DN2300_c0_g1_i4:204-2240(+)